MTLWPKNYTDEPLDPPGSPEINADEGMREIRGVECCVQWDRSPESSSDFKVWICEFDVTGLLTADEEQEILEWIYEQEVE